jgi:hypothetical protein
VILIIDRPHDADTFDAMKLRIQGNLLRFRLGRSEVNDLGSTGKIEECVDFGPVRAKFCYSLEKGDDDTFSGSFADGRIAVRVPGAVVDRWALSDDIGIEGKQKIDDRTELQFLVEKDFACRTAADGEDQSDKFPKPASEAAC